MPLPAVEEPATSPIWRQYIGVKRRHAADFFQRTESDFFTAMQNQDLITQRLNQNKKM